MMMMILGFVCVGVFELICPKKKIVFLVSLQVFSTAVEASICLG
jgi:multisubunit Na+/H+ antiporter MnhC subunit